MDTSSGVLQERVRVVASPRGLLEVTVPYRPEWIARIKTVTGSRWVSERRLWTVPDSEDRRAKLLDLFFGVLAEGGVVEEPPERAPNRTSAAGRTPPGSWTGGSPPGLLQEPEDFDLAAPTSVDAVPSAGDCIQVTRALGFLWLVCRPFVQKWVAWIRTLERSRWDPSRRAWEVPDTPENRRRLEEALAGAIVSSDTPTSAKAPPARSPASGPPAAAPAVPAPPEPRARAPWSPAPRSGAKTDRTVTTEPRPEQDVRAVRAAVPPDAFCIAEVLQTAGETLRLGGYARSTKSTYLVHVRPFPRLARQDLREIDNAKIKPYILHLPEICGHSRPHGNKSISATKFYADFGMKSSCPTRPGKRANRHQDSPPTRDADAANRPRAP